MPPGMETVPLNEAKTRLSELIRRVETGEEVVIRRGSTPVARLVPEPNASIQPTVRPPRPRPLLAGHAPKLIGPDLERLREAIEHDDPDWGWDAVTNLHKQIDTPQQRAQLADAIVHLRDQHRIGRRQAACALLNLHTKGRRLIAASLMEAVAIQVGAKRTPGGLQLAA